MHFIEKYHCICNLSFLLKIYNFNKIWEMFKIGMQRVINKNTNFKKFKRFTTKKKKKTSNQRDSVV